MMKIIDWINAGVMKSTEYLMAEQLGSFAG